MDFDGCSAECRLEYCGDGVPQLGPEPTDPKEECDSGGFCHDMSVCQTQDPDACEASGGEPYPGPCTPYSCGVCNAACSLIECGDGVQECTEECDDGNTDPEDGCDADCKFEFCGDGTIQDGLLPTDLHEECDDGPGNNDTDPDACRNNCKNAGCGDGVIDSGEECDAPTCPDGTPCKVHGDCAGERCLPRDGQEHCSAECMLEGCGDGIVQPQYDEQVVTASF